MDQLVRTRLAPSPTGSLHIGTVRTALFNWLFARKHAGQFILRIEDTDRERSKPEFEQTILAGLNWLGIEWDEGPDKGGSYGPYRQSEREEIYRAAIQKLLTKGLAYQEEGSEAVKLRVTPQIVRFKDEIRGEVEIHSDTWGGDFVIARNLSNPVFHLAVVVDDDAQKITHVIRGEDHLTNTARHILLQQALEIPTPVYAHLPLLLDDQRRKLSKRRMPVGLDYYQQKGFLPDAIVNYLALLGWSPTDDQEIFTRDELSQLFSLERVQKAGAIFSETKMEAVNKTYIRQLDAKSLLDVTEPWLRAAGIELKDRDYWQAALLCEQERVGTLSELPQVLSFFRDGWKDDYDSKILIWRKSDQVQTRVILQKLYDFLLALPETDFNREVLQAKLMDWIDAQKLGRGDTLWPMRVALTGQENSPSPFEVAAVLGKNKSLERIKSAQEKL